MSRKKFQKAFFFLTSVSASFIMPQNEIRESNGKSSKQSILAVFLFF